MSLPETDKEVLQFLLEWIRPIRIGDLRTMLNKPHSTVNSIVKRLKKDEFVTWKRYGTVELTPKGKEAAYHFNRHHRIFELFLVETLALTAKEAVSLSRISPTIIISGSCLTNARKPVAKVKPIFGFTCV